MRRIAIVLLSLGVFLGYGSAIARASWHYRHGGGHGCHGWSRYDRGAERDFERRAAPAVSAPAPAPQVPQTVVVQSPPPAAPAPVYIVVTPGAAPPGQTVVVQPQAAPAPSPTPVAVPAPAANPQ